MFLTMVSFVLVLVTLPFSLCVTVKVVQEYERAVVFRLGRLRSGGAKGPGLFFVMPCVDSYKKVDLRTVSFDVPPQEVFHTCWWGVIFGFLLTVLSLSLSTVLYCYSIQLSMAFNFIHHRFFHGIRWQSAWTRSSIIGFPTLPWPPTISRTTGMTNAPKHSKFAWTPCIRVLLDSITLSI